MTLDSTKGTSLAAAAAEPASNPSNRNDPSKTAEAEKTLDELILTLKAKLVRSRRDQAAKPLASSKHKERNILSEKYALSRDRRRHDDRPRDPTRHRSRESRRERSRDAEERHQKRKIAKEVDRAFEKDSKHQTKDKYRVKVDGGIRGQAPEARSEYKPHRKSEKVPDDFPCRSELKGEGKEGRKKDRMEHNIVRTPHFHDKLQLKIVRLSPKLTVMNERRMEKRTFRKSVNCKDLPESQEDNSKGGKAKEGGVVSSSSSLDRDAKLLRLETDRLRLDRFRGTLRQYASSVLQTQSTLQGLIRDLSTVCPPPPTPTSELLGEEDTLPGPTGSHSNGCHGDDDDSNGCHDDDEGGNDGCQGDEHEDGKGCHDDDKAGNGCHDDDEDGNGCHSDEEVKNCRQGSRGDDRRELNCDVANDDCCYGDGNDSNGSKGDADDKTGSRNNDGGGDHDNGVERCYDDDDGNEDGRHVNARASDRCHGDEDCSRGEEKMLDADAALMRKTNSRLLTSFSDLPAPSLMPHVLTQESLDPLSSDPDGPPILRRIEEPYGRTPTPDVVTPLTDQPLPVSGWSASTSIDHDVVASDPMTSEVLSLEENAKIDVSCAANGQAGSCLASLLNEELEILSLGSKEPPVSRSSLGSKEQLGNCSNLALTEQLVIHPSVVAKEQLVIQPSPSSKEQFVNDSSLSSKEQLVNDSITTSNEQFTNQSSLASKEQIGDHSSLVSKEQNVSHSSVVSKEHPVNHSSLGSKEQLVNHSSQISKELYANLPSMGSKEQLVNHSSQISKELYTNHPNLGSEEQLVNHASQFSKEQFTNQSSQFSKEYITNPTDSEQICCASDTNLQQKSQICQEPNCSSQMTKENLPGRTVDSLAHESAVPAGASENQEVPTCGKMDPVTLRARHAKATTAFQQLTNLLNVRRKSKMAVDAKLESLRRDLFRLKVNYFVERTRIPGDLKLRWERENEGNAAVEDRRDRGSVLCSSNPSAREGCQAGTDVLPDVLPDVTMSRALVNSVKESIRFPTGDTQLGVTSRVDDSTVVDLSTRVSVRMETTGLRSDERHTEGVNGQRSESLENTVGSLQTVHASDRGVRGNGVYGWSLMDTGGSRRLEEPRVFVRLLNLAVDSGQTAQCPKKRLREKYREVGSPTDPSLVPRAQRLEGPMIPGARETTREVPRTGRDLQVSPPRRSRPDSSGQRVAVVSANLREAEGNVVSTATPERPVMDASEPGRKRRRLSTVLFSTYQAEVSHPSHPSRRNNRPIAEPHSGVPPIQAKTTVSTASQANAGSYRFRLPGTLPIDRDTNQSSQRLSGTQEFHGLFKQPQVGQQPPPFRHPKPFPEFQGELRRGGVPQWRYVEPHGLNGFGAELPAVNYPSGAYISPSGCVLPNYGFPNGPHELPRPRYLSRGGCDSAQRGPSGYSEPRHSGPPEPLFLSNMRARPSEDCGVVYSMGETSGVVMGASGVPGYYRLPPSEAYYGNPAYSPESFMGNTRIR